jgi:hypothetical protein
MSGTDVISSSGQITGLWSQHSHLFQSHGQPDNSATWPPLPNSLQTLGTGYVPCLARQTWLWMLFHEHPPPLRSWTRHRRWQQSRNPLTLLAFRKRWRRPRLKLIPLIFRTGCRTEQLARDATPHHWWQLTQNINFHVIQGHRLAGYLYTSTGMWWRPLVSPTHHCPEFQHIRGIAHPGRLATCRLISSRFVWPGLARMSPPGRKSVPLASDQKSISIFRSTRSRFPSRNAVSPTSYSTWWAPSHPPMALITFCLL